MTNPNPALEQKSENPFEGFESAGFLDGAPVAADKPEGKGAAGTGEGDDDAGDDDKAGAAEGESDKEPDVHADKTSESDEEDGEKPVVEPDKKADKKPKQTAQERIAQLTHARREAERERDSFKERISALERGDKKQDLTAPAEGVKDGKERPKAADYEYGELDGKYIADVVSFETKKAIAEEKASEAKTRQTEAADAKRREYQERGLSLIEAGREKYEDFDDKVVNGPVIKEITQVLHDLILESDVGADIAHHLASNPKEAREAFGKSEYQQAAYFGRLEARFQAPPKADKAANPKPASKAPEPVKQPRGAGGKFVTEPETEDFSAFEALANK